MPAFVWERLNDELPNDPEALVFPSRKGGHLTIGEYRWVFDRAASDIGLSGLVPHELRHTCASLAISADANVKAVQTLLGHASAVMTLDLYRHLLSDDLTRRWLRVSIGRRVGLPPNWALWLVVGEDWRLARTFRVRSGAFGLGHFDRLVLLPAFSRCPRWDSNPHWTGFESVSSASWDTRAFLVEMRPPNLEQPPTIEDGSRSSLLTPRGSWSQRPTTQCPS